MNVAGHEEEYWRIFQLIRGDVEAAIKANHTYLCVNNLVIADPELGQKINRFADFWNLNAFALQTTFFIAFGRLFDTRRDALSIQKLIDTTIESPGLFSKAALRERKLLVNPGPVPTWLDEYLQAAWEPTRADLIKMKTALVPHYDRFKAIYSPIRHNYYAHRSKESEAALSVLFSQTRIGEVDHILRFLHTLLWAIQELAINGKKLDLADFTDYESYVAGIKRRVEQFIRQLP